MQKGLVMGKTIRINGRSFPSAVAIAAQARDTRDKYSPRDVVADEDDASFIAALFKAHPDYEAKMAGRELSHFEVRTYQYQTRAFFAVFTSGELVDFSFLRAAKGAFETM